MNITNEIEIRTVSSPVDVAIGILLGVAAGIAMISLFKWSISGIWAPRWSAECVAFVWAAGQNIQQCSQPIIAAKIVMSS